MRLRAPPPFERPEQSIAYALLCAGAIHLSGKLAGGSPSMYAAAHLARRRLTNSRVVVVFVVVVVVTSQVAAVIFLCNQFLIISKASIGLCIARKRASELELRIVRGSS